MLWGIAWTFASGSDIAWVTDELAAPTRIDRVLIGAARAKSLGAAFGIITFGLLARSTSRSAAIIATGVGIVVLGLFVTRIPEAGFERSSPTRKGSLTIFRKGISLARTDRILLFAFFATMLSVGGAGEGFNRMYTKQLTDVGFPDDQTTMQWFALLNLATLAGGALALHAVERTIMVPDTARRAFQWSCALAASGVLLLAMARNPLVAGAGAVLTGIALLVARAVSGVWVNRRVASDIRATVHSLLQQAEYLGEAVLTLGLGVLAGWSSIKVGLVGSALLFVMTAFVLRASVASETMPNSAT